MRRTGAVRARRRLWPAGEEGSGTVLVLVVLMLLGITGATAALLGAAIGVRHRAEAAADLAALSGASALQRGTTGPCAAAGRIAAANGAALVDCRVQGSRVRVTVSLAARGPLSRLPPAWARAYAGP